MQINETVVIKFIGVLEATRWINSLGMHNVDIESDSLFTVQVINSAVENRELLGSWFNISRMS